MQTTLLERIKALGGSINPDVLNRAKDTNVSLQQWLSAISFNTVLYTKPEDTPWASAEDQEPIVGMNDFFETNKNLFKKDEEAFYQTLIQHFYCLTDEPYGQTWFTNQLFTPFKEGTDDYAEWHGAWEEGELKKSINGDTMEFIFIARDSGYPSNLFVCLSDPKPENPTVYGTDHTLFFEEISTHGKLLEYLNTFMTKDELLRIVKKRLRN